MDEGRKPIHQPDQLIVDLQSWDVIRAELADLHVGFSQADEHAGLGLVRLRDLTDSEGEPLGVDELLAELRQVFAAQRDGFIPAMGKNRFVDSIIGLGHKIMAGGVMELGTKIMAGEVAAKAHKIMGGALPAPAAESDLIPVEMPPAAAGGGEGVRIGLVDTPILAATAESLDVHVVGDAVLAVGPDPLPYRAGHGTFVSGIVRRQAPKAEIFLAPALAGANARADSWDVATAMMALVDEQRVDILNVSLGCFALGGGAPLVMSRAIERIGSRALVVAAAGNHGNFTGLMRGRTSGSAIWPAAIPAAVAVGSCDKLGNRSVFSPDQQWVDCLALGEGVVSNYLTDVEFPSTADPPDAPAATTAHFGHGLARWNGTSFSTAMVSGAIAARTVPGTTTTTGAFTTLLAESHVVAQGDQLRA